MRICGIIAEYNPFHYGHLHLLKKARKSPDDCIIVALSGSFVQRGEIAICDKWTRAAWALEAGADLVVELPTVFVLQSGTYFAHGAVRLLSQLGCQALCFGSEIADTTLFHTLIHQLSDAQSDIHSLLHRHIKAGKSHPRAFYEAYIEHFGNHDAAAILRQPNAFLSLSYLQAAQTVAPNMEIDIIPRSGGAYHDTALDTENPSATAIRTALFAKKTPVLDWNEVVPPYVASSLQNEPIAHTQAIENLYLFALRSASLTELQAISGMTEGLEHRLISAGHQADLPSAIAHMKTKRYTHVRIQRILSSILLRITQDLVQKANAMPQPYAHILGFRSSAAPVLKKLRQSHSPIWSQKKDLDAFSPLHRELASLDMRATDIQALAFSRESARRAKKDYTHALRCWRK